MNFILPIFSAFLQAGSLTLDKVVLSLKNVTYKTYTGISFPLIFLVNLIIFIIFRPPITSALFAGNLWWLFLGITFITIATNLIFYRALDEDHLGEIQTIELLKTLPVIIFSSLIFADERNWYILIPAMVASLAIVWSHWEKQHIKIRKKTAIFLAWSLITAPLVVVMVKILLESWNPITFELVRSAVMACILGPLFFRRNKHVPTKAFSLLLLTNILTSIAWILYYFSYQRSGVIYTVLLFSIQPLLVYFASVVFLKERPQIKKIVAFGIVLISIIIAQIGGK